MEFKKIKDLPLGTKFKVPSSGIEYTKASNVNTYTGNCACSHFVLTGKGKYKYRRKIHKQLNADLSVLCLKSPCQIKMEFS
jgi:hypothetical protein